MPATAAESHAAEIDSDAQLSWLVVVAWSKADAWSRCRCLSHRAEDADAGDDDQGFAIAIIS